MHNKIRDHIRVQSKKAQATGGTDAAVRLVEVPEAEPNSTDHSGASAPLDRLLRRGLELIRPEFQDHTWGAFCLTTLEGRSSKEAGSQLGMSAGAVRNAKSRVLKRLREELDEMDD